MTNRIDITLPYPPTVNTYWRQFRGRTLLSAKGREYQGAVSACCFAQDVRPVTGRLSVEAKFYMPDKRVRDLDNCAKALLDGMVKGGLFADDGQIDRLVLERGGVDKHNPRVEVTVARADVGGGA